jgi:hypothetical protein
MILTFKSSVCKKWTMSKTAMADSNTTARDMVLSMHPVMNYDAQIRSMSQKCQSAFLCLIL